MSTPTLRSADVGSTVPSAGAGEASAGVGALTASRAAQGATVELGGVVGTVVAGTCRGCCIVDVVNGSSEKETATRWIAS